MTTYTNVQYAALRTLARAYGHGWACEPDMPSTYPIPGAPWTQSFIAECYSAIGKRDGWEPWQYGIPSPGKFAGSSDSVCHTTATGRLQWQVDPDGAVGIVICRPGAEYTDGDQILQRCVVVLSARVEAGRVVSIRTPETRDHRIPDVHSASWSPEGGPRAEARHGDTLLEALSALVGALAAAAALDLAGCPRTAAAADTMTIMMPVHQADGSIVMLPATVHTGPGQR